MNILATKSTQLTQNLIPGTQIPSKKSLLIVGNGYDLARGYPTNYTDFFKHLDKIFNQEFKSLRDRDVIQTLQSIRDATNSSPNRTFKRLLTLISAFPTYNKPNFWYVYLTLKAFSDSNWSDIETQVKLTLEAIDEELIQSINYIKDHSKVPESVSTDILLSVVVTCFLIHEDITKELTFSFLFKQLKEFEKMFKDYIMLITTPGNISRSKEQKEFEHHSAQELVGGIKNLGVSILNFNYTSFPKSTPSFSNRHQWNVHGAASSSELIFGIDGTDITPESPLYRFTKTSRLMFASLKSEPSAVLSPDINRIFFIGHSLSEADYSYFQSVFDYLSIYDNQIVLYFCYTDFHEKYLNEMEKYQLSIHSLLKKYGNTLDNKSHGDNLISKLLLEHRLQMIRV